MLAPRIVRQADRAPALVGCDLVLTTVKKLLGQYTDPAWFEAAKRGDLPAISEWLKKGVKVDARDEWDDTALTWAASGGHTDVCRLLIEKGAAVNVRQYEGATPLILAADKGHLEIVKLLVEAGADVNAHHAREEQPVIAFAARGGHRSVVDYLKDRGASWR